MTSINSPSTGDQYRKLKDVDQSIDKEQSEVQSFWKEDGHEKDKDMNWSKLGSLIQMQKFFTRQRHEMSEATLDVNKLENEFSGVEYVYNELERQGKKLEKQDELLNSELSRSQCEVYSRDSLFQDQNFTAQTLHNTIKEEQNNWEIYHKQRQYTENMNYMEQKTLDDENYVLDEKIVEIIIWESRCFIAVIGLEPKSECQVLYIREYCLITNCLIKIFHKEIINKNSLEVSSKCKLFKQHGKYIYFFNISEENNSQEFRLQRLNLIESNSTETIESKQIDKDQKHFYSNQTLNLKSLQSIIFSDETKYSSREKGKRNNQQDGLNEDDWIQEQLFMFQYSIDRGATFYEIQTIDFGWPICQVLTNEIVVEVEDEQLSSKNKQNKKLKIQTNQENKFKRFGALSHRKSEIQESENDMILVFANNHQVSMFEYDSNIQEANDISSGEKDKRQIEFLLDIQQHFENFTHQNFKIKQSKEIGESKFILKQKDINHVEFAAFQKAIQSFGHFQLNQLDLELEDIGILSHDLSGFQEDKIMLSSSYQFHQILFDKGKYILLETQMDHNSKINMITFKSDETNRKVDNKFIHDHIINFNLKIIKGIIKNQKNQSIKYMKGKSMRESFQKKGRTEMTKKSSLQEPNLQIKNNNSLIPGFKENLINKINNKLKQNTNFGNHFIQVHPKFNNVFIDTYTRVIVYLKDNEISQTAPKTKEQLIQKIGSVIKSQDNLMMQTFYQAQNRYPFISYSKDGIPLIEINKKGKTIYTQAIEIERSESIFELTKQQVLQIIKVSLSSPIYFERGLYYQNFQVLINMGQSLNNQKDWYIIQEFQFIVDNEQVQRIDSDIKASREEIGLNLIGLKYLFSNNKLSRKINFVPLYASANCQYIIGTKIECLVGNETLIEMENFNMKDYQIRGPLANSGYKTYYDYKKVQRYLLVESMLSPMFHEQSDNLKNIQNSFKETWLYYYPNCYALNQQLKTVLNMVPKKSPQFYLKHDLLEISEFDEMQPLEIFQGKSILHFKLLRTNKVLKYIKQTQQQDLQNKQLQQSVLDIFCENIPDLKDDLDNYGIRRKQFEFSFDFLDQSILEDCLNIKDSQQSFKILFNYIYDFADEDGWNSERYNMLLTILPKILQQNDLINFQTYSRFLSSDPENEKYTFEIMLNMKNLPHFSSEKMYIQNLDNDKFFPLMHKAKDYTQNGKSVKDQFKEFLLEKNYPSIKDKFMMYAVHQQLIYQNENLLKNKARTNKVEHFIVPLIYLEIKNLMMKIKKQLKGRGECYYDKYTQMEIADINYKINNAYSYEIDKHDMVRAIADKQFDQFTKQVFQIRFIGYMILCVLPFILHLTIYQDNKGMYVCLGICATVHLVYLVIECIQICQDGFWEYCKESESLNDWVNISSFVAYASIQCLYNSEYQTNGIPNFDANAKNEDNFGAFIHILACLCICMITLKIDFFLQTYSSYGLLRALMYRSSIDLIPSFIYLLIQVVSFALYFRILGVKQEQDSPLHEIVYYPHFIFEMAIGNSGTPDVSYWTGQENKTQFHYMIILIYIFWFVCQMSLTIVLLNFLIAVISQSFESVMNNESMQVIYSNKCKLNKEAAQLYQFLGLNEQSLSLMILSISNERLDIGETEIENHMSQLKEYIGTEILEIKDHLAASKLDNLETKDTLLSLQNNQIEIMNIIKEFRVETTMRQTNIERQQTFKKKENRVIFEEEDADK